MKYETRYDFGDTVWPIHHDRRRENKLCPACEGEGKVTLKNGERSCPDCYGCGTQPYWIDAEWFVFESLTVGQVRIVHTAEYCEGDDSTFENYGHQEGVYEESYMCRETGIGAGSVHRLARLFASRVMAEIECERRNKKEKEAQV